MKKYRILIPVVLFFSVFLCSFKHQHRLSDISKIEIFIKGVDRDILREGIKPVQFGEMSIKSSDKSIEVQAFQITLARGNRAITVSDVSGNKFDLKKYTSMARSGDRIVIEIKRTSPDDDRNAPSTSIFVLKVI